MTRRVTRATGSGAIAFTLDPDINFQVSEIRIHLDAVGGAGDLTISLDAQGGGAYDAVFKTQDMTAIADLFYQPPVPHSFVKGDILKITWANAGGKTYGIEVIWSGI